MFWYNMNIGDIMVLNIIDGINEVANRFKEWIIDNSTNPLLYIGLFFLGIFVFVVTYRALNK